MVILGPPSVSTCICLGKCGGIIDLDPKAVLVFCDTNGVYYMLARYVVLVSNMADASNTVTIVVDPKFGNGLYAVAKETPVWIVDTPVNRTAAEVVRAQNAEQRHPGGVTTFQVERNSTP